MTAVKVLALLDAALSLFDRLLDTVDDLEEIRDGEAVDWDRIDQQLGEKRARLHDAIARRRGH